MSMTHAELLAERHGVPHTIARTLHSAAKKHDIQYSLLLAVCQQESGFRNVWGHDPAGWRADEVDVTRPGVERYLKALAHGQVDRQGCGPLQITSGGLQDLAGHRGGLWMPAATIDVGAEFLGGLIGRLGTHAGVRSYNGSGPAAERYAGTVLASRDIWHARVTG